MRISEIIGSGGRRGRVYTTGKIKNSADRRGAASAVNGKRQFAIVLPAGIDSIPKQNDDAVMLYEGGEQLCIGVRSLDNSFQIQPGEVAVYSAGGASIELHNNGNIYSTGRVYINGEEIGGD